MDARDVFRCCDALTPERVHHRPAVEGGIQLDDVDEPRAAMLGVIRGRRFDALDARE